MSKGNFVAYYRVSTARQGASGLGLIDSGAEELTFGGGALCERGAASTGRARRPRLCQPPRLGHRSLLLAEIHLLRFGLGVGAGLLELEIDEVIQELLALLFRGGTSATCGKHGDKEQPLHGAIVSPARRWRHFRANE